MSDTPAGEETRTLRIDIASDVTCPWCVIGYKQLIRALKETGTDAEIYGDPFMLDSQVPEKGVDLYKHLKAQYGMSNDEIRKSHELIKQAGAKLDFTFNYPKGVKMSNSFRAHQLLCWAETHGKRQETNVALFKAFFTHNKDVNKISVLVEIAADVGLDGEEALAVLKEGRFANEVNGRQYLWGKRGIKGLPAMIFNRKYLVTGAQGVDGYASLLREFTEESAA